jgi:DNA-binding FadR family transcriptional regulator
MLEVENARLAAEHATPKNIARLREITQAMGDVLGDSEKFSLLDAEFHQTLAASTQNPLLAVLLYSIRDIFLDVLIQIQDRWHQIEITLPDHTRIIDKVEEHDADGAAQAMQTHLDHAFALMREVLLQSETKN